MKKIQFVSKPLFTIFFSYAMIREIILLSWRITCQSFILQKNTLTLALLPIITTEVRHVWVSPQKGLRLFLINKKIKETIKLRSGIHWGAFLYWRKYCFLRLSEQIKIIGGT